MCGRYSLDTPVRELARHFQLRTLSELRPRYNIAPTQEIGVVRRAADEQDCEFVALRWGLIPRWTKDPAGLPLLINARAETAAKKPAFREAFRRRRCVVPASGFFEWQRRGKNKQPFHIRRRDGEPLAIAGLWERWVDPDGRDIDSCVLLTTAPNDLVRPLHDRMPAVLSPADYTLWMDPGVQDVSVLEGLLRPCPPSEMVAEAVSLLVNSARNDHPDCIAPLPQP